MVDVKSTLTETLRAHTQADEYGYPIEECNCGASFRGDYAEHVADVLLGLSGVAVTALPEPVQIADVIEQTLERKSQADLSVPFARGRVTAAILAADTEGADHA